MRYPIGRISKLLGLFTETIRTYERKVQSRLNSALLAEKAA